MFLTLLVSCLLSAKTSDTIAVEVIPRIENVRPCTLGPDKTPGFVARVVFDGTTPPNGIRFTVYSAVHGWQLTQVAWKDDADRWGGMCINDPEVWYECVHPRGPATVDLVFERVEPMLSEKAKQFAHPEPLDIDGRDVSRWMIIKVRSATVWTEAALREQQFSRDLNKASDVVRWGPDKKASLGFGLGYDDDGVRVTFWQDLPAEEEKIARQLVESLAKKHGVKILEIKRGDHGFYRTEPADATAQHITLPAATPRKQ